MHTNTTNPEFLSFLKGEPTGSALFHKWHSWHEIQRMDSNHRKWEIVQFAVYYNANIIGKDAPTQYCVWEIITTDLKSRKIAEVYLKLITK